jgi:GalNAc-alpha-(1->4)-GalNAc-alpha-(1->3)-diNAcBac-PP-undecaprenol alpha-1,4-N-acetyl-D-galactosaminyltransferase
MKNKAIQNMPESDHPSVNIVMVCNSPHGGGTHRVASALCNAWILQGRKVCFIALDKYEDFYNLDNSVRVIVASYDSTSSAALKLGRILQSFLAKLKPRCPSRLYSGLSRLRHYLRILHRIMMLRRAIRQTTAPVVVALGSYANILTILACKNLGRKVIISERTDPGRRPLDPPWEKLRLSFYNHADVVTANSRGAVETMKTYVDNQKLAFVPNPLFRDETSVDILQTASLRSPFVLIVARLHPRKAHEVLLDAFASLSPELSNWRLAIVGNGKLEKELRSQATILGISERVDWYGRVANPFVFYRAAKIFVLPSRYEGMPNALLEAMSCGLPAIVSDASPGPLELVRDMENGLVVPVDDAVALAGAIELLARNADLRQRFGEAARWRVSDYEMSRVLPIWESVIGLKEYDRKSSISPNSKNSSNY